MRMGMSECESQCESRGERASESEVRVGVG